MNNQYLTIPNDLQQQVLLINNEAILNLMADNSDPYWGGVKTCYNTRKIQWI